MCDPTTALYVAGVVFAGAQAYDQSQTEKGNAKYNERALENEAVRLRNSATEKENAQRQRTAELVSRQRVQAASRGVDVNSGSVLQLQTDAATFGEVDALRIRDNADAQADSFEQQGLLVNAAGDNAARSGNVALAGSLLSASGGVAKSGVADKWFTSKSAGLEINRPDAIIG